MIGDISPNIINFSLVSVCLIYAYDQHTLLFIYHFLGAIIGFIVFSLLLGAMSF